MKKFFVIMIICLVGMVSCKFDKTTLYAPGDVAQIEADRLDNILEESRKCVKMNMTYVVERIQHENGDSYNVFCTGKLQESQKCNCKCK